MPFTILNISIFLSVEIGYIYCYEDVYAMREAYVLYVHVLCVRAVCVLCVHVVYVAYVRVACVLYVLYAFAQIPPCLSTVQCHRQ